MEAIPVINCEDRMCIERKLAALSDFLPPEHFIHIDIADSVFTPHKTWNAPVAWHSMVGNRFRLEAHLMVEHPAIWIAPWLAAGVKRFIVHVEAVDLASFKHIKKMCDREGVALMLTSNPETPIRSFLPYLAKCSTFQVLGVNPGFSGQAFLSITLEKIKWLRRKVPHAIIEVDGGMNPLNAKLAKDAGADVVVSASYIFGSSYPKQAYEVLKRI